MTFHCHCCPTSAPKAARHGSPTTFTELPTGWSSVTIGGTPEVTFVLCPACLFLLRAFVEQLHRQALPAARIPSEKFPDGLAPITETPTAVRLCGSNYCVLPLGHEGDHDRPGWSGA